MRQRETATLINLPETSSSQQAIPVAVSVEQATSAHDIIVQGMPIRLNPAMLPGKIDLHADIRREDGSLVSDPELVCCMSPETLADLVQSGMLNLRQVFDDSSTYLQSGITRDLDGTGVQWIEFPYIS